MRCVPIAGAVLMLAGACGLSRLPAPPLAAHPTSALTAVQFPPPAPRVEMIPDRPSPAAVWLDGEWTWRRNRWTWRRGRWVIPPAGARFSPWTGTRSEDAVFFFAEGRWRDAAGREVPEPQPLAVAETSMGPVIEPEGEEVALPTVPPSAIDASSDGATPTHR